MPEAPKTSSKLPENYNYNLQEKNAKALEFIEDVTANADEVQKRVLAEILSSNANVEYLKRHGLNGHTDRDTFKKLIPVITYEDIQPDIKRIANGDTSQILCSKPISEFLTRSVLVKSPYYIGFIILLLIFRDVKTPVISFSLVKKQNHVTCYLFLDGFG